jgi:hypothetical protein
MVVAALAAVALSAAPPADIASAARRLAPAGARVVLAQERAWDRGVAAWDDGRTPTATPLEWRSHAWRRARRGGVTLSAPILRITGRSVYQEVRATMRQRLLDVAMFVDGRPVDVLSFPGPTRGEVVSIATNFPRGRHVAVAYAAIFGSATARAWTFRVR